MKLTETNLVELGFTLVDISAKESGNKPFHYYEMDLSNENKEIISYTKSLLKTP